MQTPDSFGIKTETMAVARTVATQVTVSVSITTVATTEVTAVLSRQAALPQPPAAT